MLALESLSELVAPRALVRARTHKASSNAGLRAPPELRARLAPHRRAHRVDPRPAAPLLRALAPARGRDPRARDTPIVLHYSNKYSVNIASGVWRPKKHKAVARAAHQAWRALYKQRGGRVWLRALCMREVSILKSHPIGTPKCMIAKGSSKPANWPRSASVFHSRYDRQRARRARQEATAAA